MDENKGLAGRGARGGPVIGIKLKIIRGDFPVESDDQIGMKLLLLLILILLNAFFAMSEIAVISVNDNKIRRMADDGNVKARNLAKLIAEPSRFLSTIQIGITLAGFLASAFAAESFAGRLAEWVLALGVSVSFSTVNTLAVILITVVLSYVTLVVGELAPKRVAMQKSEEIALFVAGAIQGLAFVAKPAVRFLTVSTNLLVKLLGFNPEAGQESVTEEEIRMMMDLGEEIGAIAKDEKEMIENIFEFNNKTAAEVMTHRTDMTALWIDEDPEEVKRTLLESSFSRLPVYDEDVDDVVGILHVRDYLVNSMKEQSDGLKELLRPAYFVPEQVATDVLFRDMQRQKIHMAVVVDEYGGTSGIVTVEDLLEEIVGNIYDEYDDEVEADIEDLGGGVWRIRGSVGLEELEELFHINLPNDDYDTLGGLIFSQLNSIPEENSLPEIEAFGLRVRVEQLEDRRVEWAVVSKSQDESRTVQE
jgi:putative hemolysin